MTTSTHSSNSPVRHDAPGITETDIAIVERLTAIYANGTTAERECLTRFLDDIKAGVDGLEAVARLALGFGMADGMRAHCPDDEHRQRYDEALAKVRAEKAVAA